MHGLILRLLAATGLLFAATTTEPQPTASPAGSPVAVVRLPGDTTEFSGYDFRQDGFGGVDWPVEFVFRGNASITTITDGLCHGTQHAWKYCDPGGPMYLYGRESAGGVDFAGFVANSGLKRFQEHCSTTSFTAHMRLYAPKAGSDGGADHFTSAKYGNVVIATVHLDFEDDAGCSGRIHGFPDVAEQWFVEAMKTIPGWQVSPDAWNLGNASDHYVILRDLDGALVPHVYGHDGLATDVVIP